MTDFQNVTTNNFVNICESASGVFGALLGEVRELSKKKPDATLSKSKVTLINNVLSDLNVFLKGEPEGKYLNVLEDDELPQVSDALMMMAQFESALRSFRKRYYQLVKLGHLHSREHFWITEEQVKEWEDDGVKVIL